MFGKAQQDFLGGIGGMLFAGAFIIRFFAPFGTKQVNMEELNAHITDGLAKMPREKLPQLIAETAASLKDHFKDKAPAFGQIYIQLATDLYRYHGIALPDMTVDSPTMLAQENAISAAPSSGKEPAKPFATTALKKSPDLAALKPPASHQQRAAAAPSEGVAIGASS